MVEPSAGVFSPRGLLGGNWSLHHGSQREPVNLIPGADPKHPRTAGRAYPVCEERIHQGAVPEDGCGNLAPEDRQIRTDVGGDSSGQRSTSARWPAPADLLLPVPAVGHEPGHGGFRSSIRAYPGARLLDQRMCGGPGLHDPNRPIRGGRRNAPRQPMTPDHLGAAVREHPEELRGQMGWMRGWWAPRSWWLRTDTRPRVDPDGLAEGVATIPVGLRVVQGGHDERVVGEQGVQASGVRRRTGKCEGLVAEREVVVPIRLGQIQRIRQPVWTMEQRLGIVHGGFRHGFERPPRRCDDFEPAQEGLAYLVRSQWSADARSDGDGGTDMVHLVAEGLGAEDGVELPLETQLVQRPQWANGAGHETKSRGWVHVGEHLQPLHRWLTPPSEISMPYSLRSRGTVAPLELAERVKVGDKGGVHAVGTGVGSCSCMGKWKNDAENRTIAEREWFRRQGGGVCIDLSIGGEPGFHACT